MSEKEALVIKTRYDALVVGTFNTSAGKELLKEWISLYLEGDLFAGNDSDRCYNIGQRDFVLEITAKLKEASS